MAKPPGRKDPELSLTAVVEAVTAVMRASHVGGTVDQTLAGRIGAQIQPELAKALQGKSVSGAELVGQQAFRNILSQHLSGAPAANDEESRRAMRDYLLRHANRSSAEFAALVAQHARGGGWNGRAASDVDAGESGSGLRFTALTGGERMTAPILAAQALALKTPGLGWAAHNHELLRIPGAIESFARMQFDRESYHALTGRAGYAPAEAVAFVMSAEKRGMTPKETKDFAQIQGEVADGLPAEQKQRLKNATQHWLTKPGDEKAAKQYDQTLGELERDNPHKNPQIDKLRQLRKEIDAKRGWEAKTGATSDAKDSKAAGQENKAAGQEARAEAKTASLAAKVDDDWNDPKAPTGAKPADPASHGQPEPNKKPEPQKQQPGHPEKPKTKVGQAAAPKPT